MKIFIKQWILNRIKDRKAHGIMYRRGGAGKENVPANTRLGGVSEDHVEDDIKMEDDDVNLR